MHNLYSIKCDVSTDRECENPIMDENTMIICPQMEDVAQAGALSTCGYPLSPTYTQPMAFDTRVTGEGEPDCKSPSSDSGPAEPPEALHNREGILLRT